jgi:hypothetical protein
MIYTNTRDSVTANYSDDYTDTLGGGGGSHAFGQPGYIDK